jgi:glucose/arabinose dehydrogenase
MNLAARAMTILIALLPIFPAGAADRILRTEKAELRIQTIAEKLEHPWGLALLPDGRLLVTERPGRLRIVAMDGRTSPPLTGVPDVDARGQGGLLDIVLHPRFAENRLVYFSYAEPGSGGNSTAVSRGRLGETGLTDVALIFRQLPKVESAQHFGSRLVFDRQGLLWITTGERSQRQFRDMAQDLTTHLGKVIRVRDDGSVPPDNPFVGRADARPEIWSYGHRNPQGLTMNPWTGTIWEAEHGPRGGDEINIPRAGRNYGWPVVTLGREYSGQTIWTGTASPPGMEDPLYHWTPSVSPSGMAFYDHDSIPGWRGSLLLGTLNGRMLVRLEIDGERVVREEQMLKELGYRIRDVRVASDGSLFLLTDEDNGKVLRVNATGKPVSGR